MTKHPFFTRLFPHEVKAHKAFHRQLQCVLPEHGSVLDLGCGDHSELARYRSPRREVWGTDFHAHPRLQHSEWFRILPPGGSIPFEDGRFDVVTANWVLEHIEQPVIFLQEVNRVLRPGGWFVALTINGRHYVTLLARLLRLAPHALTQRLVNRLYGRPCADTFPTFYRLNTEEALRRTAAVAGLKLREIGRHVNPGYFGRLWPLAVLADWSLERLRPGLGRIYLTITMQKLSASSERTLAA